MITELEIVDTAVKIGLGAIISGLSAYLLARLSHRNELDREFIKRRRDRLESLANQFHAEHVRFIYYHTYTSVMANKKVERSSTELAMLEAIRKKGDSIELMPDSLTAIQGQLMLLGESDAASQVRAYGKMVGEYITFVETSNISEIEKWQISEVRKKRDEIFNSLSNAYRQS